MVSHFVKVWQFLKKLHIYHTVQQFTQFTQGNLTSIYKITCSEIFIAASFIIFKNWKQPKCLPIDEQINKLLYIHTREYYTVIKTGNSIDSGNNKIRSLIGGQGKGMTAK